MTKTEKEILIDLITSISSNFQSQITQHGKKQQRCHYEFTYKGAKIYKSVFMAVYDVGKHALQNITKHKQEYGVVARNHQNSERRPSKSLNYEDVCAVLHFISNYSQEVGIPQPAAPRGRDGEAPVYLPSDTTRIAVHKAYQDSCAEMTPPARVVKYSTFNSIWRSCVPHIKIASPREDVCATWER